MSANAIGTGAIILSANADKMVTGLVAAGQKVQTWAKGLSAKVGDSFAVMTPGGMIAKVNGITGGVLSIGKALEDVQDIAKQGNIAKAMGMTSEQFTGIAGVASSAGEDTREFIESLVTLGKVAEEGAAGKGEVAAGFFKALNVDAKQFAQLRPDQMFFQFFEAVQKVQDPLQRTRMLMVAFGEDGGKYLLPLLSKSPAELRKMADSFALSSEKMKIAQDASIRLTEAQVKFKMLWRDLVIAAAPVFEFMASELSRMVDGFDRMGSSGTETMEKLIRMSAKFAEATKTTTAIALMAGGARLAGC